MKGADEEGVGPLIGIRVRFDPGYESYIGIVALLRHFVLSLTDKKSSQNPGIG